METRVVSPLKFPAGDHEALKLSGGPTYSASSTLEMTDLQRFQRPQKVKRSKSTSEFRIRVPDRRIKVVCPGNVGRTLDAFPGQRISSAGQQNAISSSDFLNPVSDAPREVPSKGAEKSVPISPIELQKKTRGCLFSDSPVLRNDGCNPALLKNPPRPILKPRTTKTTSALRNMSTCL